VKFPGARAYQTFAGAVLLVFADMFEHRTAQGEVQLYENAAAERMMFIHRNWRGKSDEPPEAGS